MEEALKEHGKLEKKIARLKQLLRRYKQTHHLQDALIQLSERASTVAELTLLYPAIHEILEAYLPTSNFFVVLHNPQFDELELSYFVDEKDGISVAIDQNNQFMNGITGHVFDVGETRCYSRQELEQEAAKGTFTVLGSLSEHWLGVPVYRGDKIIGVIVSQSYDKDAPFTEGHIELMEFISMYLATAIERVRKREMLESEVKVRTQALSTANDQLQKEVAQRLDALKRQQILFQIAELASSDNTLEQVYQQVHTIIQSVTHAENFFISLYDKESQLLSFPYAVDEVFEHYPPRAFAKGYSELVITKGKAQLIDRQRAAELSQRGELVFQEATNYQQIATSWLGVPLKTSHGIIGLVVLQAYNNRHQYDESDVELMTFVSSQIAKVIDAQLAKQTLAQSHQLLEDKVAAKTKELRQANLHLQLQIEERKKIEEQLYYDAHHDNLTGIANRSLFLEHLEKTLSRYKRHPEHTFAVLFIDLDKFKEINDVLGHLAGDQFLIKIAKVLGECIRDNDLLARLGGDEFVILLNQLDHPDSAKEIAQRIIERVSEPYCHNDACVYPGASIGITYSRESYQDIDEVIRDADSAMYYAKSAGRGRYEMYHPVLANTAKPTQEPQHHASSMDIQFKRQTLITSDDQKLSERVLSIFGQHPVLGAVSFSRLKRLISNDEDRQAIELNLFSESLKLRHQEQKLIVPCSTQLLRASSFEQFMTLLTTHEQLEKVCLMFNEKSLRHASSQQLANFSRLKAIAVDLALSNLAHDRAELNILTLAPFKYVMLSDIFSRRVAHEPMYQQQLTGIKAVTSALGATLIATGPNILEFREQLTELGIGCFVGEHLPVRTELCVDTRQARSH